MLHLLCASSLIASSGGKQDGDPWPSHSGKPLFPVARENAPLAVGVDTFPVRHSTRASYSSSHLSPDVSDARGTVCCPTTDRSPSLALGPRPQIGTANVFGGELPDVFFLNSRVHAPYAPTGIFLFRVRSPPVHSAMPACANDKTPACACTPRCVRVQIHISFSATV